MARNSLDHLQIEPDNAQSMSDGVSFMTGHFSETVANPYFSTSTSPVESNDIWDRPIVLSLDGGGIRGYWTLLVIQALMCEIAEQEQLHNPECRSSFDPGPYQPDTTHYPEYRLRNATRFLPCHYFDLIVGSSTGAMPVSDCLEEYKRLSGQIFYKPSMTLFGVLPVFRHFKYRSEYADAVFEDFCARRAAKHSCAANVLFKSMSGTCKTCLTTSRIHVRQKGENYEGVEASEEMVPLCCYSRHKQQSCSSLIDPVVAELNKISGDLPAAQVARAATAARFMFKEVRFALRNGPISLGDGGMLRDNNPIMVAVGQAQDLTLSRSPYHIRRIVSIGTARKDDAPTRSIFDQLRRHNNTGGDPHLAYREFLQIFSNKIDHDRFDNRNGVRMPMDEWKPRKDSRNGKVKAGSFTIKKLEANFESWYNEEQKGKIRRLAKVLVDLRLDRSKNTDRWERYAEASRYRCYETACSGLPFRYRSQFESHLSLHHQILGEELDKKLRESRHCWEYCPSPDRLKSNIQQNQETENQSN